LGNSQYVSFQFLTDFNKAAGLHSLLNIVICSLDCHDSLPYH
jgi:hypothetical protein